MFHRTNAYASLAAATLCAGGAFAEIELTGATVVSAPTVISEKVTGPGYYIVTGGATLTLDNSANDFTGGVIVSNGVLEATAPGSFGSGQITLAGTGNRSIRLNSTWGTFPNDVLIKDAGTSSTYPALNIVKSAKWTGNVAYDETLAAADSSSNYIYYKLGQTAADTGVELYMEGQTLAGAGRIYVTGWGRLWHSGKMTCGSGGGLFLGSAYSECGRVTLSNPESRIGRIVQSNFDLDCTVPGILKGTQIQQNFNKQWGNAGHNILYLTSSQEFAYFNVGGSCDFDWSQDEKWGGLVYNNSSTSVPTIWVTGEGLPSASGGCHYRFYGNMNIVMTNKLSSADNTLYQAFRGRRSPMVGNIEVNKRCQFRVMNGTTFAGVTNLLIRSGGSMTFEKYLDFTSPVGNTFTGLKTLRLEGNAYIRTDVTGMAPPINSPKARVVMDADSRIYLRSGVEATVRQLCVAGREIPAGDYTKDNLPQLAAPDADHYYWVGGTLHVLADRKGMAMLFR